MRWCRIVEASGLQHCLRILPADESFCIEISWATEDGVYAVAIPGESFSSQEELMGWFYALSPDDMDKARWHFAKSQTGMAEEQTRALISRAMGGIH